MPYGHCRDCVYCRSYGKTFREVADENGGFLGLEDYTWQCERRAPVMCRSPRTPSHSGKRSFLGLFPQLRGIDVCDSAMGCGDFDRDKE